MSASERGCALVTGGTRGIGAAVTERLRADGWRVATLGRTSGDVQADVADSAAVQRAFDEVRERFGDILVLVNNAGVRHDGLAIRMPEDEWQSVVDTNLTGAFHCTRRALDDMLGARWGRIVNVSSVVAERANPGQANYVAAKAGLLGFTRTVAREMARKGITCNAVTPGFIETDMTAEMLSPPTRPGATDLKSVIPAGRVGRPEDVANAVAFLCSDDAEYITGATLAVDGGMGA